MVRGSPLVTSIYLEYGQDFVVNPKGGLQTAVGWDEIRQSVIRFLLTCRQQLEASGITVYADYIWHPDYGLGLPAFVGELLSDKAKSEIERLCKAAVAANPAITKHPKAKVLINQEQHNLQIFILANAVDLPPGVIAIDLSEQ